MFYQDRFPKQLLEGRIMLGNLLPDRKLKKGWRDAQLINTLKTVMGIFAVSEKSL